VDSAGVNHGFLLHNGVLTVLDFPAATFTQALGLNNLQEVVGTYMDASGNTPAGSSMTPRPSNISL
jgi:hypothetical protein